MKTVNLLQNFFPSKLPKGWYDKRIQVIKDTKFVYWTWLGQSDTKPNPRCKWMEEPIIIGNMCTLIKKSEVRDFTGEILENLTRVIHSMYPQAIIFKDRIMLDNNEYVFAKAFKTIVDTHIYNREVLEAKALNLGYNINDISHVSSAKLASFVWTKDKENLIWKIYCIHKGKVINLGDFLFRKYVINISTSFISNKKRYNQLRGLQIQNLISV